MKPFALILASLLAPLASAAPIHLPPEYPFSADDLLHIHYEPLSPAEAEELRALFPLCHSITFCEDAFDVQAKSTTLTQGKRLRALLNQLATHPQWFERCCGDVDIDVEQNPIPAIRMQDEEGEFFYELEFLPEGVPCIREGERYVSLWELCRRFLASTPLDDCSEEAAPPKSASTPATRVLKAQVAKSELYEGRLCTTIDPEYQETELAACFEGISLNELRTNTQEGIFGAPTRLLLTTDAAPCILIMNNVPGIFTFYHGAQEVTPGFYEVSDEALDRSLDVFLPELYEKLKAAGVPHISLEELQQGRTTPKPQNTP